MQGRQNSVPAKSWLSPVPPTSADIPGSLSSPGSKPRTPTTAAGYLTYRIMMARLTWGVAPVRCKGALRAG